MSDSTDTNDQAPPQGTQAITRAVHLLHEVAVAGRPPTLSELSRRLGLAAPTAHRILRALTSGGLVQRDHTGLGYCIGPEARRWADRAPLHGQVTPQRTSPFHHRLLAYHASHGWRDWSGTIGATSYEPSHEHEYFAIRNAVGLIDVSPLFKYEIRGPQAAALVDRIFTRDFTKCRAGQVMYTCWCDDDGKLLQDGNVVRLAEDRFRVTAAHATLRWFEDCARGYDVEVREVTDELAALAVQGPRSRALLVEAASQGAEAVRDLAYFRAAEAVIDGVEVLVSRTGFTGDLGYEVWIPSAAAETVWDALMLHGSRHGALPAGLVALDQSRVEAGLVLIDIDFNDASHALLEVRKSTPYEVGLGWTVKMADGKGFVGRAALERAAAEPLTSKVVGIAVEWPELERLARSRGMRPPTVLHPPSREPAALLAGGRQVGQVTSQTWSPVLKKHIALATVQAGWFETGTELELEMMIDYRRMHARARVADLPFYDPPRKRAKAEATA